MSSSNTAQNSAPGRPFKKNDPRINRGGRPKNFDTARKLALKLGNEAITSKDGKIAMTRFEMILRDWLSSGNFQKQKAVLELAFGKVPDNHNVNFGNMSDDELRQFIAAAIGINSYRGGGSKAPGADDSD